MKLAVVSDEISENFNEATKFGLEWGITDYEIRNLTSGRVPFVSDDELKRVLNVVENYNVNISAISTGLFRISLKDEVQLKLQIEEHIYESFRIAERLNTRNVIIFGFKRYPNEPKTNYIQVVHILGRISSLAEKYGFNLLLENCPKFWADNGAHTTSILDDVGSKNLKANWDLANAACAGEIPYPYGYLTIRKYIRSIHVKDIRFDNDEEPKFVVVGEGTIDWDGQLRAISQSQGHAVDYLTIETHCKPLIENTHRNLLKVENLLESYKMDESNILK